MSIERAERIESDIAMEEERRSGYKKRAYFPDTGPYRRELYPKHMATD